MKKLSTIGISLLILCLFVKPIFAQDSTAVLTGIITDDLDSNASMYDAVVFLKRANGTVVMTTTANNKGFYKMKNIKPGKYYVECEAIRYYPEKHWRSLKFEAGENICLDLELRDKKKKAPRNKWKDAATITPACVLLVVGVLALL